MNQMRNAIYHLARFMAKNNVADIENRLETMGQNIGSTFVNYWKPTETITTLNVKDVISTIYKKLLNSSVSVEVDSEQKIIIVKDYKCPLCSCSAPFPVSMEPDADVKITESQASRHDIDVGSALNIGHK